MSRSPRDYLLHIRDEVAFLVGHSEGLTFEAFERDETLRRAFVRSLEIIGEATKQLPPALLERYPAVPWRQVTRMRDRLIHGYFSVSDRVVWDTVQSGIPVLATTVERMLAEVDR